MADTSTSLVRQAAVSVNEWIVTYDGLPPVELVRPKETPCCAKPSRPLDGQLALHGHGSRRRSVSGLLEMPDCVAARRLACKTVEIRVRRYRCMLCGRTMTVLPAEVRPHAEMLWTLVVVALGLWAYHADGPSAESVRQWCLGLSGPVPDGWRQLRRWASADELVAAEQVALKLPPKRRAAEIVRILAARAPPDTRDRPRTDRALKAVFEQSY
jgi:hypothetical protein